MLYETLNLTPVGSPVLKVKIYAHNGRTINKAPNNYYKIYIFKTKISCSHFRIAKLLLMTLTVQCYQDFSFTV